MKLGLTCNNKEKMKWEAQQYNEEQETDHSPLFSSVTTNVHGQAGKQKFQMKTIVEYLRGVPVITTVPNNIRTDRTSHFTLWTLVQIVSLAIFCLIATLSVVLILSSNTGIRYGAEPFRLVNRSAWDARDPTNTTKFPHQPVDHVIIIHTASQPCSTFKDCSRTVRIIQEGHMEKLKFDDIAFNFLVGGDAQVYEGRGWDFIGANAELFNNRSLGIAFIGYFENFPPPQNQLEEAKALLSESVKRGKLSSDYKLVGQRQLQATLSPGQALYDIIRTWPHWEHCYKLSCLT